MNRLHAELRRLYLPNPVRSSAAGPDRQGIASDGLTRVAVLEVGGPTDWPRLATVWQAVQEELGLPAPAIAVNGVEAHQLWFSFAEAVPVSEARVWLEGLQRRWLSDLDPHRVRLHPCITESEQAWPVPAATGPERWSAFIVPGLAPLFAEEPWLDTPPSPDAQADLLARCGMTAPEDFLRARTRMEACPAPLPIPDAPPEAGAKADTPPAPPSTDPRAFLRSVLSDPTVDLALRIEAARILLAHGA